MWLTPAFSTPAVCSRIFHSCIFHPCNYARAAFSTPAFSVAPFCCLWRDVETSCDKHFVVVSHHQQSPPLILPAILVTTCHGLAAPSRGVADISTPLLPEVIPEIDANPASFYEGGGGISQVAKEYKIPNDFIMTARAPSRIDAVYLFFVFVSVAKLRTQARFSQKLSSWEYMVSIEDH